MTALRPDWFASDTGAAAQAIIAGAGVALVAADEALRVWLWNPAAARLFGAEADAILGTPLLSVMPGETRAAAAAAFNLALHNRESAELEFRYPDDRGRFRELAANVTPLIGEDGAVWGVLLAVRDVTRRFEAERQASEARKMSALGDMAGAVAHHFNNILGGIATTIDFALMNGDEVELRAALEKTAAATSRAAQIVHGLLAFAEGDRRNGIRTDLHSVLARLGAEFSTPCRRQHVEWHIETSANNPQVPESAMSAALRQLIQNALDAMPSGGRIDVRDLSDEHTVRVEVEDRGPGLPPEAIQRIFEPFYRIGASSDRRATQRAGLGLSIAYGMIRGIGGTLHVRSEPGQGACFTVEWPKDPQVSGQGGSPEGF